MIRKLCWKLIDVNAMQSSPQSRINGDSMINSSNQIKIAERKLVNMTLITMFVVPFVNKI